MTERLYTVEETVSISEILAAPTIDNPDENLALPNLMGALPGIFGGEQYWGLDYAGAGVAILCKGRTNLDYRRTAAIYVVTMDDQAIAVLTTAGRSQTDHREVFILDEARIKTMAARLAAVYMEDELKTQALVTYSLTAPVHLPKCGHTPVQLGVDKRDADWG